MNPISLLPHLVYTCWVRWIGGGSRKWQQIGSGPCEVGADRQMMLLATGRQHRECIIPQAVTHSLVLLKMGKIIARNMLS